MPMEPVNKEGLNMRSTKYKCTMYWAIRATCPEYFYTPVDKEGKVNGAVCCLPEVRETVCNKRRSDHVKMSMKDSDKTPIWC